MTTREIVRIVMAEPFRPFRIQMDDGTVWHVHHPEMFALGVAKMRLDTWLSELEDEAKTRQLSLLTKHIQSIQFLN